jgi:pilus assembly protein FimV
MLSPSLVFAAGLGKLTVLSALGQPLRAEVEVVSLAPGEADSLTAKLASIQAFQQAGIDYNAALQSIKLAIERRAGGKHVVVLTSQQPLNEPFFDILIELNWTSGRLLREYTFLLDPPEYKAPTLATPAQPAAPAQPAPAPAAAAPEAPAPTAQPVPVVPVPVPAAGTPQPAPAAPSEPSTQTSTTPEVVVPVPAPQAPAAADGEAPTTTSAEPAAPQPAPPEERALVSEPPKEAVTYQVRRGDTLARIAQRNKIEGVTLQQMLVALFQANQDAFVADNMNRLRTGKILTIPDKDAATALGRDDARRLVTAQWVDFEDYRRSLGLAVAEAPARAEAGRQTAGKISATAEGQQPTPPKEPQKDQLRIARAEDTSRAGKAAASSDDLAAKDRALREANERVAALEKNVADMKKLLDLKSGAAQQPAAKSPQESAPTPAAKAPQDSASAKAAASATKAQPEPAAKSAQPEAAKAPVPVPAPAPAPAAAAKAPAAELAAKAAAADASKAAVKAGEPAAKAPEPIKVAEASKAAETAKAADAAKAPTDAAKAAPPASAAKAAEAAKAPVPPAADAAKAAPKAAPTATPPAPVAAPGMFDDLLSNEYALAGLAGVVVLLGFYAAYAWRKKKREAAFADSVMGAAPSETNSVFGTTGGASIDTGSSSFQSDFSQSGIGKIDTEEIDPIAEADVYMAYGRDAQAEEILKEALAKDSSRQTIRVKLLEIYANRKDTRAFETVAGELYAATNGQGPEWQKATALGSSIDPQNPLYGGRKAEEAPRPMAPGPISMPMPDLVLPSAADTATASAAAPALDFNLDLGGGGGTEAAQPDITLDIGTPAHADAAPGGLDFDLGLGGGGDKPSEEKSDFSPSGTLIIDQAPMPEAPAADASLGIDFDLPGAGAATAPASPALEPAVSTASSDGSIEFDLGTSGAAAPAAQPEPAAAPALDLSAISLDMGSEPAAEAPAGGGDARWQEVATKLDLAKAYEEMGDKDGARELLKEVVKEGDSAQQQRAQSMLAALG